MKVGTMDSRNLPPLNEAKVAKRYQIGNYLFMEFFDIPSNPAITYVFALLALDVTTKKPALCITSERTGDLTLASFKKMLKTAGEDLGDLSIPFFCVTHENSFHENFGSSPDWANQKKFFAEAKRYACEELGLENDSSQVITKPSNDSEGDRDKWLGIMAFLFFVAVCMAYCAFKSDESDEQKRFMLGCLGSHNDSFCERLWERKLSK